jgi:hypothetical protein
MIPEPIPSTENFREHALMAVSIGLQQLQAYEYASDEHMRLVKLNEILWQMMLYRASLLQGLMGYEKKQYGQWEYKKPEKKDE